MYSLVINLYRLYCCKLYDHYFNIRYCDTICGITITHNVLIFICIYSFVVLCMNCCLPRVMRSGYEIAVNIASVVSYVCPYQEISKIC